MITSRQLKETQVKEISTKIANSQAIVVAEYQGLTVKELQELRFKLNEKNVELKVYKNRIFKIAAKKNGLESINEELKGPNIYAFGMSDNISPVKVIAEFAKKHKLLKIKIGTFENRVLTSKELQIIANLPTWKESLSMLANSLIFPVQQISILLNLLSKKNIST